MDKLNDWFTEQSQTPIGSVLVFIGVFLARVAIAEWSARRARRKTAKHRRVVNGS